MDEQFGFEKLDVYQEAIKFNDKIYEITRDFPKSEMYGLISQIRRCSSSIALNIAEGYGRYHKKLKNQFYYTARASVYECIPILTISLNQKYIKKSEYDEIYNECLELSRMISGLIDSINKRNTN
ncbi:four helix bundle protein [[Eubacterium] cellulosolvens]